MTRHPDPEKGRPVPSGRLSRAARLGALAGGIAGEMAWTGARRLVRGEAAPLRDLLLTPANAARFADRLAEMRGAAMKVGQLLSMEAGDVLPPELAAIMARLRADAHPMPPHQLRAVLTAEWGADFTRRFRRFDVRPLAAASIGQVHRAETREGADLAIKIQYPGVRESIDSDVANVGSLIRLSGLAPRGLDLAPLLDEARRQLHDEADYRREARELRRFHALLQDDPGFRVPCPHDGLTTDRILAMAFEAGEPLDALDAAPQSDRDAVAARLFGLAFREIFGFGAIQSDPNLANFRIDRAAGRVILLDFGATRDLPVSLVAAGRALVRAALAEDRAGLAEGLAGLGLATNGMAPALVDRLVDMCLLATEPLRAAQPYDFGRSDLLGRLRRAGADLDPAALPLPPIDGLYVQRKLGGLLLMATRFGARVDLRALLDPWLD